MKNLFRLLALSMAFSVVAGVAHRCVAQPSSDKPFVVEYYYKTKWGHADEFLSLFKKNHYPLLKKEVEMGRMLKVWNLSLIVVAFNLAFDANYLAVNVGFDTAVLADRNVILLQVYLTLNASLDHEVFVAAEISLDIHQQHRDAGITQGFADHL